MVLPHFLLKETESENMQWYRYTLFVLLVATVALSQLLVYYSVLEAKIKTGT